ncbi:MAG: hypothetical protein WDA71_02025 [Actinomycetota bacterium]
MSLALDDKVAEVARAFRAARIPYAFGGALALAYYGEPRGTVDIDVNVFVSSRQAGRVLDRLERIGCAVDRAALRDRIEQDGQARVFWDTTPLDLFFSVDAFHESCARRARDVPFGPNSIRVLSAEDLAVFKAIFNRRKDWIDIEQILFAAAPTFDTGYVRAWLDRIVGPDDARRTTFDETSMRLLSR